MRAKKAKMRNQELANPALEGLNKQLEEIEAKELRGGPRRSTAEESDGEQEPTLGYSDVGTAQNGGRDGDPSAKTR
jgi:hypothetical protein